MMTSETKSSIRVGDEFIFTGLGGQQMPDDRRFFVTVVEVSIDGQLICETTDRPATTRSKGPIPYERAVQLVKEGIWQYNLQD